jgi:hypothetical protein
MVGGHRRPRRPPFASCTNISTAMLPVPFGVVMTRLQAAPQKLVDYDNKGKETEKVSTTGDTLHRGPPGKENRRCENQIAPTAEGRGP